MTEVVTYLRVNINDKWTNLGIVAEENEIQEHFDFVEGLLKQKQQINNLKTEILKINNDAVNSGNEEQMAITGRVIEVLENTIVDDWRVD
ncbi:hypothetical protein [Macrococcoides canis]|uniref:hypothetical protein n=1 Tax=Macrococcoides canis TaxID=1855823 RepID=UPI0020B7BDD7|nr:hypothetical protein [Macrococcus canis]UTH07945.1 hypothetical protein KFV07_05900 [Macrococcus canis]